MVVSMKPVPRLRLTTLSILVAVLLTLFQGPTEPVNASPKAKKASARSVKKTSKGKSRSTSARASSRRGGSRSSKATARSKKKGGRLYAQGRGRGRRSRWRRQVATSSHGVGVHNYLSEA